MLDARNVLTSAACSEVAVLLSALATTFVGPSGPRVKYDCAGKILVIAPNDGGCDRGLAVLVDMLEAFRYEGFAEDPRFNQGFRGVGNRCQARIGLNGIAVGCTLCFRSQHVTPPC